VDRDLLFRQNMPWAAGIARKLSLRFPPCFELQDLVQEAHIELWKRAQRFDENSGVPFQGYAYLPVRGAVLMLTRRRRWKDATCEELFDGHVDDRPLPDQALCDREAELIKLAAVEKSLGTVRPELREMVVALIDGRNLEQIAADFGLSRGSVGRRLRAAIAVSGCILLCSLSVPA